MTRYWITTHWPQYQRDPTPHKRGVYLQAGQEKVGRRLGPDDKVLIYESATGKTLLEELADGSRRPVALKPGRSGIVTAADVADNLTAVSPSYQVQCVEIDRRDVSRWRNREGRRLRAMNEPQSIQLSDMHGYNMGSLCRP
jgi:hypothetical protein